MWVIRFIFSVVTELLAGALVQALRHKFLILILSCVEVEVLETGFLT